MLLSKIIRQLELSKTQENLENKFNDSCIPLILNRDYRDSQISQSDPKDPKTGVIYQRIDFRCEPWGNARLKEEIIRLFCRSNNLVIPKKLSRKNASQIHGLFKGMTQKYGSLYKVPHQTYF